MIPKLFFLGSFENLTVFPYNRNVDIPKKRLYGATNVFKIFRVPNFFWGSFENFDSLSISGKYRYGSPNFSKIFVIPKLLFFWEALKIWQSFPITEMSIFLKKDCTGLPMFLKYFEFQTFFEEALKILTVFPYQGNIGAGLPMFQKYLWFQNCFFFGKFWKFWQSFPITEMSIFLKKDCTGLPMFLKYFEFQNFFFLGSFENFDSLSL